jgi:hypothetical protein
MCESRATSKEHVPPQCLFPEEKDLPPGINLRKNLITVPSCDEHNTNKSKNDKYLLFCLLLNIANNDTAFAHFSTKIVRAINLNPKTYKSFTQTNMPVKVVDNETGISFDTHMFKIDAARILTSLEQISRALYFKQFKKRFEGKCIIVYDFALYNDAEATKKMRFFKMLLKI